MIFLIGLTVGAFIGGVGTYLWINRPTGNLYTAWKGYRLGDMFLHEVERQSWLHGSRFHRKYFPQSIATEYLSRTEAEGNFQILNDIIQSRRSPDQQTCVVHLRIGDILEKSKQTDQEVIEQGVHCKDGILYVQPISFYREKLDSLKSLGIKRIVLVGGSHVRDRSYAKSNQYIRAVARIFEKEGFVVNLRLAGNPDDDLVFLSSASWFIESGGGFTRVAKELVSINGGSVI
ncbi:MAG: hypothetical protein P8M78_09395 [Myxococcota bacterium]|nr:hypothetical protein [Myxococcota bacterium]